MPAPGRRRGSASASPRRSGSRGRSGPGPGSARGPRRSSSRLARPWRPRPRPGCRRPGCRTGRPSRGRCRSRRSPCRRSGRGRRPPPPGPARRTRGDLLAHVLDLVEVVAEDLDADRRPDAGGEHVDPVDDRLREDVPPAGHLERRVHLLHQVLLRLLPEEEPVGERLLQRGAEGLQLLRRRGPSRELAARPRASSAPRARPRWRRPRRGRRAPS